MAYSLCLKGDIIYVGGNNEFGFLKKNQYGEFVYHSLRHSILSDTKLSTFWQMKEYEGDIYFQTHQKIIRWDGQHSTLIEESNMYLYNVGDQFIASGYGTGLYSMDSTGSTLVNEKFTFGEDAVYAIVPLDEMDSSYLIISGEKGSGAYKYWPHRNHDFISWDTDAGNFLNVNSGLHAVKLTEDVIAVSCRHQGLLIISTDGRILNEIYPADGLLSAEINELVVDHNRNLWVTTDFGISKIQWDNLASKTNYQTFITKIYNGDSALAISKLDSVPFEIHHDIEIEFTTPGIDKLDLLYSVYLEGAEPSWGSWKQMTSAKYTNLKQGKYSFHVRSKSIYGTEISEDSLDFEIIRPWYQRWWLIPLAVLIVLFIIVFIYSFWSRSSDDLSKMSEKLEDQNKLLTTTAKKLAVTNTELDHFVYRASHDLVAPLKSVRGLINLAKFEPTNDRVSEYHILMEESVLKLEEFIKSIMEYSVNSNLKLTNENIDLNSLTSGLLDEIQFYPRFDEVTIKSNFIVKNICSDQKRLSIILNNFITNAIKYHDFLRPAEVIFSSEQNDNGILIKVIDNGPGIESEHLDKVFDMFYRARQDSKGSGLGLYIVKESADLIDAKVWIESEFGKGTTACLQLASSSLLLGKTTCE